MKQIPIWIWYPYSFPNLTSLDWQASYVRSHQGWDSAGSLFQISAVPELSTEKQKARKSILSFQIEGIL